VLWWWCGGGGGWLSVPVLEGRIPEAAGSKEEQEGWMFFFRIQGVLAGRQDDDRGARGAYDVLIVARRDWS